MSGTMHDHDEKLRRHAAAQSRYEQRRREGGWIKLSVWVPRAHRSAVVRALLCLSRKWGGKP